MQAAVEAFLDGAFAGHMIATVHATDSRELDWLMVDPAFHGLGVADALMQVGVDWLGSRRGALRPRWISLSWGSPSSHQAGYGLGARG